MIPIESYDHKERLGLQRRRWGASSRAVSDRIPPHHAPDFGPVTAGCPQYEGYSAYPGSDHPGSNLRWSATPATDCDMDPQCRGFNTDGWMKHTVWPRSGGRRATFCIYVRTGMHACAGRRDEISQTRHTFMFTLQGYELACAYQALSSPCGLREGGGTDGGRGAGAKPLASLESMSANALPRTLLATFVAWFHNPRNLPTTKATHATTAPTV